MKFRGPKALGNRPRKAMVCSTALATRTDHERRWSVSTALATRTDHERRWSVPLPWLHEQTTKGDGLFPLPWLHEQTTKGDGLFHCLGYTNRPRKAMVCFH